MSEKSKITIAAGVIGACTLASRILGFARDVVIAWFFGAGLGSDAFFVAFRIPNLLRRLFAEGSLSMAFVPVFTDLLAKDEDDAFRFACASIRLVALILCFVSAAGVLLAPQIVQLTAPGFSHDPEKIAVTVRLTAIVFPYIFFIGLVALAMGILNSLGRFAAPALAPVFLNIAMISSVAAASLFQIDPLEALAFGVLAGGLLQMLLQIPFLLKRGIRFWTSPSLWHPAIKKMGILMGPTIFGAAVYQLNILTGTILASLLPQGSVSYLYYADRLVQFPLGIFGIALATAVLPGFSRQAAAGDHKALSETFAYAVKLILFITLPATAGLIMLGTPIIGLLFERGAFTAQAVKSTAWALLWYSAGLWAFACVRITVAAFFSLKDTKTPVKLAVVALVANICLGILLMKPMGHGGLALATSLSSSLHFLLLLLALRKKLGSLHLGETAVSILKSATCSVIMAAVVWAAAYPPFAGSQGGTVTYILQTACGISAGLLSYMLLAYALKCKELGYLIQIIAKKGDERTLS